MLVYKINPDSKNSVQQVMEPVRIAAYPNPANRNQMVTIQLSGEHAGKTPTEIQVTNLQGQTTEKHIIPAGQIRTTIPANTLSPGMNIIRMQQKGEAVGSAKVIVN